MLVRWSKQADREPKKARFVAFENTDEELPPNSGGPSTKLDVMEAIWKEKWRRRGWWNQAAEDFDGGLPREPSRSQTRKRDGDEAEDERPDRYQAVQEDKKDIVIEEVKSFNQVAFKMNQKVRE